MLPASLKAVVPRSTQDQKQKRDFVFAYRAVTFCGTASQQFRLTKSFVTLLVNYVSVLQPSFPCGNKFGLFPFRSPLLREYFRLRGYYFLFLPVLRCFTSRGTHPWSSQEQFRITGIRFPHSEISGSKVARHLPDLS